MPLARGPGGQLGVRASNDDSLVQEELRQLRESNSAENVAIARNTGQVARLQRRNDGQGAAVRAPDPSQPIEVRVVA